MPEDQVVVAAAILRGGRLLAARRTTPPALAGRGELPGGKVEPGETYDVALRREVDEELGCRVQVVAWLPRAVRIRRGLLLRVAHGRLLDGDPSPTEHDRLRWLSAGELYDVDWLEPDLPFLPDIARILEA